MSDPTVDDTVLRDILEGCEGVQGGPYLLDKFAAYIWAPSEKGGDFPIGDNVGETEAGVPVMRLRGWGYYAGNGQGGLGLSPQEAAARQRRTGEHLARLDPQTVASIITELLALRNSGERP